jgi:hypothetical protein
VFAGPGTTIRFENEDEKGFLIRSGVMMNPEYEQVGRYCNEQSFICGPPARKQ